MKMITLPRTNLNVSATCLGGNVFGWTANRAESFEVLSGFAAAGGNFIDTADVYSMWAPGNSGGESETLIGDWMKREGNRERMVVATKVAKLTGRRGLARSNILAAADDSLRRLQTDYIDLYYAHEDDPNTPLEETLGAFDQLVRAGKVRYLGASNYSGARLREAVRVSRTQGLAAYVALQNQYNLLERADYERDAAPALAELGLSGLPYFALASGFLTGKYQPGIRVESARAGGVAKYATSAGWAVVEKLGRVATELGASPAAVALAWLRAQPTVSVPIASARTAAQLAPLLEDVTLGPEHLALLG